MSGDRSLFHTGHFPPKCDLSNLFETCGANSDQISFVITRSLWELKNKQRLLLSVMFSGMFCLINKSVKPQSAAPHLSILCLK